MSVQRIEVKGLLHHCLDKAVRRGGEAEVRRNHHNGEHSSGSLGTDLLKQGEQGWAYMFELV